MYAIIEESGTQTRVRQGDVIVVDLLKQGKAQAGEGIVFDRVLVVGQAGGGAKVGTPYVGGASVKGEVVEPVVMGDKIDIYKFSEKKGYKRKTGHRQRYSSVKVTSIVG